MGLTLITPPAAEPVTLADLKSWMRVETTSDDILITAAGIAAREHVEKWLGRQLVTAIWELTARCFADCIIRIPRPPLQSIVSLKYRDTAGVLQTLDPSAYLVDITAQPGTVESATSWPRTGDYPDAVQVRFTAGYGDAATVPEPIRTAIKMIAGELRGLARDDASVSRETVIGVGTTEWTPAAAAIAQAAVKRLLGSYKVQAS